MGGGHTLIRSGRCHLTLDLEGYILRRIVKADITGAFIDPQAKLFHFFGRPRILGRYVLDGCFRVEFEKFGGTPVAIHIIIEISADEPEQRYRRMQNGEGIAVVVKLRVEKITSKR